MRLLQLSSCGTLLLAAATCGGLRVWETRAWHWESNRRFGRPVAAAAWAGQSALMPEAARTLLLVMEGEAIVHALRFPAARGANGSPPAPAVRSEYVGFYDLASLTPHPSPIVALAWEPRGERLVVGWKRPAAQAAQDEPNAPAPELTVLATKLAPAVKLNRVGHVYGHARGSALGSLSFCQPLVHGAALLSAGWDDGHVSLLPLFF